MITRHPYKGGVWIDIENPNDDDIRDLAREFQIGDRIEKEILSPTPFPLVSADTGATLLVLHFPGHGAEDGDAGNQEVDFVVSEKFILTVRYEVIAPLHHLKKLLETQTIIEGKGSITTDVLLEVLFAHLYTSVRDHTNHIASRLEHVERQMFDGHERLTIRAISNVSREYLHMEAALANHEEPLGRFLGLLKDRGTFNGTFAERSERILNEHMQVARLVSTHREVATELRETNIALLEARQNEIMKTLTVITFIFLPLELITFVFGMHVLGTPLENHPDAFWIITGTMAMVGLIITLFLAKKRWIF
jgi:magnesium transporter